MILRSLLISLSCYTAIAIFLTLFVFPETMNHANLARTVNLLRDINAMFGFQAELLKTCESEGPRSRSILETVEKKRRQLIAGMQQCERRRFNFRRQVLAEYMALVVTTTSGLVNLEFSWGRWNGDDIKALEEPLLAVVTRGGA